MCGRFVQTSNRDELFEHFGAEVPNDYVPSFNVAPTDATLIIKAGKQSAIASFGLVPAWSNDPLKFFINARSETVHEKASFREAFESRRCLIPSNGFYEWKKIGNIKRPQFFRMIGGAPFAYAGIYDQNKDGVVSCAILTTSPNELIEQVHDRMPVILSSESQCSLWLNTKSDRRTLQSVYQATPSSLLETWEVSKRVNTPSYKGPECIVPL